MAITNNTGNVGGLSAQEVSLIQTEATALASTVDSIGQNLQKNLKTLGKLTGESNKGYEVSFTASKSLAAALQSVDSKTLASKKQQLDFSNKVRKAEEEATRIQAKANRLRQDMTFMSAKEQAAALKIARAYDEASDHLADQAISARQITSEFEELNKAVKPFNDLKDFFAEIPGLSKVFGEFQNAADASSESFSKTGDKLKAFKAGAKELGGVVFKSLTAFGLSTIVKGLTNADERIVSLSRNLNKSSEESAKLVKNFNAAARGIQGLTGTELEKGATILSESLGSTAVSSNSTAKELAGIVKTMGMSTEEAAKQAEFSQATGQDVAKAGNEMRGQVMLSNLRNKTSIKYQSIMKDVASTSNATKLLMQGQGISITKAAIEAKKLGTTLEGISKIGSSMLDFESSIANELEAELLTGGEINNERARALALKGDELGLAKEVEKSGVLTKFANADNVLQQEALAKAYGMSKEEMADMVVKSRALTEMGASDSKDLQKKYDKELKSIELLKKKGDLEGAATAEKKLSEKLGGEELERQLKNQTIADKQAEAMSKMAEAMDRLIPLLDKIKKIFDFITENIQSISKGLMVLVGGGILNKLLKMVAMVFKLGKSTPAAQNTLGNLTAPQAITPPAPPGANIPGASIPGKNPINPATGKPFRGRPPGKPITPQAPSIPSSIPTPGAPAPKPSVVSKTSSAIKNAISRVAPKGKVGRLVNAASRLVSRVAPVAAAAGGGGFLSKVLKTGKGLVSTVATGAKGIGKAVAKVGGKMNPAGLIKAAVASGGGPMALLKKAIKGSVLNTLLTGFFAFQDIKDLIQNPVDEKGEKLSLSGLNKKVGSIAAGGLGGIIGGMLGALLGPVSAIAGSFGGEWLMKYIAESSPGFAEGFGAMITPLKIFNDDKGKRGELAAEITGLRDKSTGRILGAKPEANKSKAATPKEDKKFAIGGIISRPTRAIVGEAGPEAVVPLTAFYGKIDRLISVVQSQKKDQSLNTPPTSFTNKVTPSVQSQRKDQELSRPLTSFSTKAEQLLSTLQSQKRDQEVPTALTSLSVKIDKLATSLQSQNKAQVTTTKNTSEKQPENSITSKPLQVVKSLISPPAKETPSAPLQTRPVATRETQSNTSNTEVVGLLKELIVATKQGKPVYLDGNRVNAALGQSLLAVGG